MSRRRGSKRSESTPEASPDSSNLDELAPETELITDEDDITSELLNEDSEALTLDVSADGGETATLPVPYQRKVPENLSALNVYLARLGDVEILPIEEQNALARHYQLTGDPEAVAKLVASNLRLVVKMAFQFRRQWADVMDLVAEGNVGLAEAIRKFDADRGVPFPSYARFWIRARILAFIQENKHLVHTGSRAARKLFWRLEREKRGLLQEGLEPTPKRLAERVGVEASDVNELAPILENRAISLDVPVHGEEAGRTRADALADPTGLDPERVTGGGQLQDLLREVFQRFRETLNERDRVIWDQRLQSEDPLRLEDIGNQYGISKERVRQLEARIKSRLKEFVQDELGDEVIIEALH